MTEALIGIAALLFLELIAFSFWLGTLSSDVKRANRKLDSIAPVCNVHSVKIGQIETIQEELKHSIRNHIENQHDSIRESRA